MRTVNAWKHLSRRHKWGWKDKPFAGDLLWYIRVLQPLLLSHKTRIFTEILSEAESVCSEGVPTEAEWLTGESAIAVRNYSNLDITENLTGRQSMLALSLFETSRKWYLITVLPACRGRELSVPRRSTRLSVVTPVTFTSAWGCLYRFPAPRVAAVSMTLIAIVTGGEMLKSAATSIVVARETPRVVCQPAKHRAHTDVGAVQGTGGLRWGLVTAKIRGIVGEESPSF